MKKYLLVLALTAVMVSQASMASALQIYFNQFKTRYPKAASLSCGACHVTPTATNTARNAYGAAFALHAHATVAQRNTAFTLVEKDDADNDGFTNLTEITATTAAVKVLPGFAALNANFPSTAGWRATPPKLLFFDNFSNAKAAAIPNWTVTGTWNGKARALTSSALSAEAFANPTPPKIPAALSNFKTGVITANVKLVSGNSADVVFSQSAAGFRVVGISNTEISIGADGVGGDTKIPFIGFANQAAHTLKIVLAATGRVDVFVDNVLQGSHKFPAAVAGTVGFRTKLTAATFDNVSFSK